MIKIPYSMNEINRRLMVSQKNIFAVNLLFLFALSCAVDNNSKKNEEKKRIYVSENGSDQNSGKTRASSLQTLAKALTVVNGGEEIFVTKGRYSEEVALSEVKFDDPIVITGESGASIFDGNKTKKFGISLGYCKNIIINNLSFINYNSTGIRIYCSSLITVSNCVVSNNGFDSKVEYVEGYGIAASFSKNITISGNNVFNNGPSDYLCDTQFLLGTGINTYMLVDSIISSNCSQYNNGGGILVEDGINVIVENNNSSYNNKEAHFEKDNPKTWWCGGVWVDGGNTIIVRNNTFKSNKAGILLSDEDGQEPFGYVMENNLLQDNTYDFDIYGFGKKSDIKTEIINFKNNSGSSIVNCDNVIDYTKTSCTVNGVLCIDNKKIQLHQDGIIKNRISYAGYYSASYFDAGSIMFYRYTEDDKNKTVLIRIMINTVCYQDYIDPDDSNFKIEYSDDDKNVKYIEFFDNKIIPDICDETNILINKGSCFEFVE